MAPDAILSRGSTRRGFVGLAMRQGWRDKAVLASACGVSVQAIHQILARVDSAEVAAAALCLGDRRLLRGWRNVRAKKKSSG